MLTGARKLVSCTREFLLTAPLSRSRKIQILVMLAVGNALLSITYAWDQLMDLLVKMFHHL